MKIAYIAAGAGGMYCGSCLRDNALARELIRLGHPTLLIPTYTPMRTDEESVSTRKVFYGGIGVFLAEKFGILRGPLPFLDRLFSSNLLLKVVSRLSISTRPESLGALTVSVLSGEEGHQRKALDELLDHLGGEVRPDVVHLTNSMFAGLVAPLKRRLGVPVVVTFQGEDLFLESLPEAHRKRAIGLIQKGSEQVDAFIAVSRFTADFMAGYLGLDRARIRVVPPGIRPGSLPPASGPRPAGRPFTIGYLARIAPEKGLAFLCEAFRSLKESIGAGGGAAPGGSPGGPRLIAAGTMDGAGRPYLEAVEKRIAQWGLTASFDYEGELDRDEKVRFLQRIDVLSVPATYPEAMGLFAYEALAAGVPVVLPRRGAFPEIVESTGGGLLTEPGDPQDLARGLRRLMDDPALREDLGRRGSEAVRKKFTTELMARSTLAVYEELREASRAKWR